MNPEDISLSEINETEKDKYGMILFIYVETKKKKNKKKCQTQLTETKNGMVVTRS